MPEMPAFLANRLEPIFARRATVTRVDDLAPRLRRIHFQGDDLKNVSWRAGGEVELRMSETAFRHYTPSALDKSAGTLEIVFYLHGHGPGSRRASALAAGDHVNVLGPGGSFSLDDSARAHVLLGDETCLGLFAAFVNAALPGTIRGAVEVERGARSWPELAGVPLTAIERGDVRGAALRAWLELASPIADATYYLCGHAATIRTLRQLLRDRDLPRGAIRTRAYWADGKRGL